MKVARANVAVGWKKRQYKAQTQTNPAFRDCRYSKKHSTYQHEPVQPDRKIQIAPPIRQIALIPHPARALHHPHRRLPPRRPAQHQKRRHRRNEPVVVGTVERPRDAGHDLEAPARDGEGVEEDLLALVGQAPVADGIEVRVRLVLLERFAVAVAHVLGMGVVGHLGGCCPGLLPAAGRDGMVLLVTQEAGVRMMDPMLVPTMGEMELRSFQTRFFSQDALNA